MNIIPDNSSLVIDGKSYSLIKRGVDFDSLKCECEPYTADIQPTFIVVKKRHRQIHICCACRTARKDG